MHRLVYSEKYMILTTDSRRPTGEPVDERHGDDFHALIHPEANDEEEESRRQGWAYGDLEEDNVWGR